MITAEEYKKLKNSNAKQIQEKSKQVLPDLIDAINNYVLNHLEDTLDVVFKRQLSLLFSIQLRDLVALTIDNCAIFDAQQYGNNPDIFNFTTGDIASIYNKYLEAKYKTCKQNNVYFREDTIYLANEVLFSSYSDILDKHILHKIIELYDNALGCVQSILIKNNYVYKVHVTDKESKDILDTYKDTTIEINVN